MVDSLYSADEENQSLWVYLEQERGELAGVSLELLGRGQELVVQMNQASDQKDWKLAGLLLGNRLSDLAGQVVACGADQVYCVEHPLLENFTVDAFTHAAYHALMQVKPGVFLLGATPDGRDLAGRLAVRLRTGLNADCTDLTMDSETGTLICEVSGFGGGVLAMIQMTRHRPQMATVRPGVFSALAPDTFRTGQIIPLAVNLTPELIRTRLVERVTGQSVDLRKVSVLVAGGRGMSGDFASLADLAALVGGEVGATRPPVDEGHIERERQVGQTGVVCSPKIAICCGISGAFHFVVGIEKAGMVIAINSDPEAQIFESSDYCIVGDVHQVLPELINALRHQGWDHGLPSDQAASLEKKAAHV